jgi:hypothetical protein
MTCINHKTRTRERFSRKGRETRSVGGESETYVDLAVLERAEFATDEESETGTAHSRMNLGLERNE